MPAAQQLARLGVEGGERGGRAREIGERAVDVEGRRRLLLVLARGLHEADHDDRDNGDRKQGDDSTAHQLRRVGRAICFNGGAQSLVSGSVRVTRPRSLDVDLFRGAVANVRPTKAFG